MCERGFEFLGSTLVLVKFFVATEKELFRSEGAEGGVGIRGERGWTRTLFQAGWSNIATSFTFCTDRQTNKYTMTWGNPHGLWD